ncbi:MAG: Hsp20/alpha crystallin family protein [Nitrospirales bacterium]|nr:Hsp20/alpha crystallin family protein [Nitrospirales bacterium]
MTAVEPSRAVSPFEEMEKWMDEAFRRPFHLFRPLWMPSVRFPGMEEFSPHVDIFEDGNDVVMKAEIPGMKKDDLDVTLTEDTITISGEKRSEEKVEKKNYHRLERSYGSFSRSFRLPDGVQTDKAKASFKDGVLEIRIPKLEETKKNEKKLEIE